MFPSKYSATSSSPIFKMVGVTYLFLVMLGMIPQTNSAPSPTSPTNLCDNPDPALMFCNCDDPDQAVDINCFATNNSGSEEASMWDLFAYQSRVAVLKLSAYQGHTFSFFPVRILGYLNATLEKLIVSQLNFTTLPTGALRSMSKLTEVDFTLCERMRVAHNAFESLPALKKVTFSNSNFGTLVDMFENVPSIEELYLEENQIVAIEPGAFSALATLKYLYLDKNQIVNLNRDIFKGLTQLTELTIIRNRIRYLPPFAFAEMSQLTSLDLTSNEISVIDANAFSGLPALSKVSLARNKLRQFPPGGVFSASPTLAIVDIGFNEFEHLSWQVFYQPEHARYIRLRIKGNKIQCTCALFWMSVAVKSYDSIVKHELKSTDCTYANVSETAEPDAEKLAFGPGELKPLTILDFITSAAVKAQCKLPAALVSAQEEAEKELNKGLESEVGVKIDDGAELPKLPQPELGKPEEGKEDPEEGPENDELDSDGPKIQSAPSSSAADSELISKNDSKMNRLGDDDDSKQQHSSNDVRDDEVEEESSAVSKNKQQQQNSLSHASIGAAGGGARSISISNFLMAISVVVFCLSKFAFAHRFIQIH